MFQARLHLRQDKPCILTRLAAELDDPMEVTIEKLYDGDVTFIADVGDQLDECHERFANASEIQHFEVLDGNRLLATKPSCGAYSAVYENHGILRRTNTISRTRRTYTVLFFDRDDLRHIIDDFRKIGTVTIDQLGEVGRKSPSPLTDRQREVLEHALEHGYFEWPRRTTSEELATDLGITRATYLEHLRKAERTLLPSALEESA